MTKDTGDNPTALPRATTRAAKQDGVLSGLVTLFTIDTGDAVLRLLGGRASGGQVAFGGQGYAAFPVAAKGFAWSAEGPPAHPQIELSNLARLFDGAVTGDRLRGRSVRRILTLADQLDPPHGKGGASCFPPEQWVIERVVRLDNRVLRLELAAEASLENRRFPERVMLRDMCQHRYRRWDSEAGRFDYSRATCPYTAARGFTATGAATLSPEEDVCSLRLSTGCRVRFSGTLPFVGFPGLARF